MKTFLKVLMFAAMQMHVCADPQITSWFTMNSDKPARIFRNDFAKNSNQAVPTWSNGRNAQAQPAFCGVQEILSSSNWIYVRSTGLAGQIMGPWQDGRFPNLPTDQHFIFSFRRHPVAQTGIH